jgi:hypothetical protein
MRRTLRWLGWLFCAVGVALFATYFAMSHEGLTLSYNFGDPAKFQFILVPFWQIGLVILVLGETCLLAWRRFDKTRIACLQTVISTMPNSSDAPSVVLYRDAPEIASRSSSLRAVTAATIETTAPNSSENAIQRLA